MGKRVGAWFLGGAGLVAATMVASAAGNVPATYFPIDQGVDQPTLEQYHHTDQGTRLVPAAWLAALEMPDGSGKVMSPDVMRRYGFLVAGETFELPGIGPHCFMWRRLGDPEAAARADLGAEADR